MTFSTECDITQVRGWEMVRRLKKPSGKIRRKMMSKGSAACKNCGEKVEGDFLELCKKFIVGLPCPKCGNQIGKVNNVTKEENKNEKNSND